MISAPIPEKAPTHSHAFPTILETVAGEVRGVGRCNLTPVEKEDRSLQRYRTLKKGLYRELSLGYTHDALDFYLKTDALASLVSVKAILLEILHDLAILYQVENPNYILELDRSCLARRESTDGVAQPYGNAEAAAGTPPIISLVMPNYNKSPHIEGCLKSIISQNMNDYELLIVDDGSTDDSFAKLKLWADSSRQIRLWRMSQNSLPGKCRNFALDKCRGRYVIFIDSDDRCLPGYFEQALREMLTSNGDMAIFSTRVVFTPQQDSWDNKLVDAILTRCQALDKFACGMLEPAPWGKIFALDTLRIANCRFPEGVYHQDVPFFFNALDASAKITTSAFLGYERIPSEASATNPAYADYIRLHSAYIFQSFCQRSIERLKNARLSHCIHIKDHLCDHEGSELLKQAVKKKAGNWADIHSLYNLRKFLLPNAAAWQSSVGIIPLSASDHSLLTTSAVFHHSLFRILAEMLANRNNRKFSL